MQNKIDADNSPALFPSAFFALPQPPTPLPWRRGGRESRARERGWVLRAPPPPSLSRSPDGPTDRWVRTCQQYTAERAYATIARTHSLRNTRTTHPNEGARCWGGAPLASGSVPRIFSPHTSVFTAPRRDQTFQSTTRSAAAKCVSESHGV